MQSILRQHPDVFVESLTGTGTRFTLNKRLAEYDDDDDDDDVIYTHSGPSRTSGRPKTKKKYVDPDENEFDDEYNDDDAVDRQSPWKSGDVLKRKRSDRGGGGGGGGGDGDGGRGMGGAAGGGKLKVKFKRGGGYDAYEEEEEEEEEPHNDGLCPCRLRHVRRC